ncbi:MAG: sorbitol-6-phosphate dehydrogenase [Armatimonadaceae bacterium]
MRLTGKSALITGAAQGLGEAIARRLADEGCNVVLTDLNRDKVETTAHNIAESTGQRALGIAADVTNEDDCAIMVEHTMTAYGKLDIVVANAGILIAGPLIGFSASDWRKVIEVNLTGYFLVAQAAARVMIPRNEGCIVQINSKSGKKGSYRNSAYSSSKFGGIGLTQSLALELAPHNIRVNAVCPGNLLDGTLWQNSLFEQYSETQGLSREELRDKYISQVPLGRAATYDDVCGVVVFLCSSEASYMTGQAINVTGGQEMR